LWLVWGLVSLTVEQIITLIFHLHLFHSSIVSQQKAPTARTGPAEAANQYSSCSANDLSTVFCLSPDSNPLADNCYMWVSEPSGNLPSCELPPSQTNFSSEWHFRGPEVMTGITLVMQVSEGASMTTAANDATLLLQS